MAISCARATHGRDDGIVRQHLTPLQMEGSEVTASPVAEHTTSGDSEELLPSQQMSLLLVVKIEELAALLL